MIAADYFLNADLLITISVSIAILYILSYILSAMNKEGFRRSMGYIWRWLEGTVYSAKYLLQRRIRLMTIISLIPRGLKILAQGVILCAPLLIRRPEGSIFESVVVFFKSGGIVPVALIYIWIYDASRPTLRLGLPIPKDERKRLTDTAIIITKIGDKLKERTGKFEFRMERIDLLQDIIRKINNLMGYFEGLELNAAMLVPCSENSERMRVIARSGHRDIDIEYPMCMLAAGEALKENRNVVTHKLKHFVRDKDKDLTVEQKKDLLSKPYKSVLALPIRATGSNKQPVVVGAVSIDADKAYYFRGKGIDLDIALRPYLNILAMTLPKDTPALPTVSVPTYLKH
jgi:hypothetical protein